MMDNLKFYSGATQDNIQKAITELKREGNEVIDIKFKEISDEFILLYKPKPKTQPPEEDLRDIGFEISNPSNPNPSSNFLESIKGWAKDNWFIVALVGFGIFYYSFIYKK